ncbi:hypothetical protein NE865_08803 [Phthorimaea operculella]|nr:hypothetical protein NE865_08803 [Phthorimaea operculella]
MDTKRSPTGSDKSIGRSGSQPNLTSEDLLNLQTFRNKRKHFDMNEDNIQTKQLADLHTKMEDMMILLTSSIKQQKDSNEKIQSDTAVIRTEINAIRDGMRVTEQKLTELTSDQAKISSEVEILTEFAKNTTVKITSLETELQNLKVCPEGAALETPMNEILAEFSEQNIRKRNLIIYGITEPESSNPKERISLDKSRVTDVLKQVLEDRPEPKRTMRVGKYRPDNNRPIKVHLESEETVKLVLRNKSNIKDKSIKIFSDQTPFQQKHFKELKAELQRRTENGEENLKIKYIKNVPKIVVEQPKKSNT